MAKKNRPSKKQKNEKAVESEIDSNVESNVEPKIESNVESLVISAGSALKMFEDEAGRVAPDFLEDVIDATAMGNEDAEVAALDEEDSAIFAEKATSGDDEDIEDTQVADTEGSELDMFASAEIEDIEDLPEEKITSIVESLLYASDKPQSVAMLKAAFSGTKVRSADIRKALKALEVVYMSGDRGVELVEVASGYQIRTKPENATYMQRTIKARPFRLSGPALEVLSIVAYKQPCPKAAVDEIRGVESGHLMRGLLDRGLITFGEKSDLPGRPMYYETTRKFLEIFGLRQIQELPTLNEIDQLIPEGIGQPEEKKQTLSDLTGELSQTVGTTYSEGEADLMSISEELQGINLSTAFFEEEKRRQRDKKDLEKAQEIRERMVIGEAVSTREKNWLERYDSGTLYAEKTAAPVAVSVPESVDAPSDLEVADSAAEVTTLEDLTEEIEVEEAVFATEVINDDSGSEPEQSPIS